MNIKWYEPVDLGSSSLSGGYCTPCNVWWMGNHKCPTPRDREREALITDIVRRVISEYGDALDRLARE